MGMRGSSLPPALKGHLVSLERVRSMWSTKIFMIVAALQMLFTRLWGQMPDHRQSLHVPLVRLYSHVLDPAFLAPAPDALVKPAADVQSQDFLLLRRFCSHVCDPPHSFHRLLMRLWGQMPDPRHSLHVPL